jgi:hypothetical protein
VDISSRCCATFEKVCKANLIPGAHPTKYNLSNFTNICNIFSQICVHFLQISEKLIIPNMYKYLLLVLFSLFYKYPSKQLIQNASKKLVLPENIGKKVKSM